MSPPTQTEFEGMVARMLAAYRQKLQGEHSHHFEKMLAQVLDAYRQLGEEDGEWVTIQ